MRRARFNARPRAAKSALTWVDVSGQWSLTTAVTATATLVQLQAPANLSNLTADPPEDMTVLRVVGDYTMALSAGPANWTLGLLVADVTWTPGATFTVDADKRILWHRTYEARTGVTLTNWAPPGYLEVINAAGSFMMQTDAVHLDISPRVRIEPGKALYLVAWENSGAVSLATTSADMRLLFKRSGRR